MKIVVNGEEMNIGGGSVSDLLGLLQIDPVRVAVELNMEILPKSEYAATALKDGDLVEIVHFVGGGSTSLATETRRHRERRYNRR